ncbi:response regulator [Sagittula salina]|uniref:Response regulator n=1 Tax=Sagittula salina TaxID=2820268 RepID=A0A940MXX1_9RHOB|nr:response regulator [Sagittula salina]MBP0484859.1 response regulator [Sagittula salina]
MVANNHSEELAAIRKAYQDPSHRSKTRGTFEILVLDDNSFDQNQIKRACGKTGLPVMVRLTSTMDEFEVALDEKVYDVILIDYLLPKGNGLAAQRLVNNHAMNFGAAVVMMSSTMRTDVAVASMKKGSLDALDKDDLNPDKLRELMIASAKIFSETSRHWIGELLAQQRVQIAQDVAKVVREEMEFGRFIDTIDKRIIDMLASKGFTETEAWNASYLFDSDEPLKFR